MKFMLVTGGAGFIGSNFIRYMERVAPTVRVYNLDAMVYPGCFDNVKDLKAELIRGNIENELLVERLVTEKRIDTIVHFAAESHVDYSIENPEIFLKSNVVGTFTLLEVARVYDVRFHHVSTDEVYGSLDDGKRAWTEQSAYDPRSPYSASKAASDHFVRAYGNTYGLRYTITNSSNNYGRYQFPDKLIPLMIGKALRGEPLTIHGDGLQIRDWLHIDDNCEAIHTVLTKGEIGQTYNVGGSNQWTVLDIVNEICSVLDELRPAYAPHAQAIMHVEDRTGQDRRYAMNIGKLKKLGWTPRHELKKGLREVVRWYV